MSRPRILESRTLRPSTLKPPTMDRAFVWGLKVGSSHLRRAATLGSRYCRGWCDLASTSCRGGGRDFSLRECPRTVLPVPA